MTDRHAITVSIFAAIGVLAVANGVYRAVTHGRPTPGSARPERSAPPSRASGTFTHIDAGGDGASVILTHAPSTDGLGQSDHSVAPSSPSVEPLDLIHLRESSRGTDPRCFRGVVGPAGERGEYQITPIFEAEVKRLGGGSVDVYDTNDCRRAIILWMGYWAPQVDAESVTDRYELYRRGPTGFRRWRTKEN